MPRLTPKQQFLHDLKNDPDYGCFLDNTKIRTYQNGKVKVIGSYGTIIAGKNNPFKPASNTAMQSTSKLINC